MREDTDAIRAHYNADPQKEWDRLMKKHPYEKYITVHIMDRYIQPGCSILDIGGGPQATTLSITPGRGIR